MRPADASSPPPRPAVEDPVGTLTDVQRFSVHDGPGIRTTVFLKGCPLSCPWCHNPETQRAAPEIVLDGTRCIGCGECRAACPIGAIQDGRPPRLDRERCRGCGVCAEACPTMALSLCGQRMSARAVTDLVARDLPFYEASGGGVTLSGGEPTAQPEFAAAILAACRARGIGTAIETSGWCAPGPLEQLLRSTDLVLFDLKTLDPQAHRRLLGQPLAPVMASARLVAARGVPLVIRVPVVPGLNDDEAPLRAILAFAAGLTDRVAFIPLHTLAEAKYRRLGRAYPAAGTPEPSPEALLRARRLAEAAGLAVVS